ncbi:uncharacterized protein LOC124690307 [Lolium rigidum]|uniref:uncharacterized protein LOC124690307 n=1 Tax=Lolium rigidum TaxID=89674 RepID=UPI001F5D0799|nr:uncharacterized protein LOC124690307 [Lolium rigidum]
MDRPQRRNPSIRPLKPPRPPGGLPFRPPPASRPAAEPSSPDGRPRKKVRFASEPGSHHIQARQDANTGRAEKSKPQGSGAKTSEFKFFKKMWEQSGCVSHSSRQPHQNNVPSISKQKEGERIEAHNATSQKKFPVQKVTLCPDQAPATPLNNAFSNERVEVQAPHSEHDSHDTPQLKPCDGAPAGHVFTPMIQTPFELTGISRNTEPGSGRMFSEKRRNLLKLASKTAAMESCELLQKRSEFFADIMQRLGASNIIRKHHKEPMRQREMVHGQTPSDPGGHSDNLLEYRDDFNSLSKLRSGKESSSYTSDGSHQFLALPWVDNRGLSSFLDWENGLSCRGNEAHQFMPLPSAYITDVSSSGWKRDTVRNQVSNLLLEDAQPLKKGKSASANGLGGNIQSEPYDHHGCDPMLLVTSVPKRFSFPCQTREQSVVPYALSNTSWQPEFSRSLEHCPSRSVGLEGEDLTDAGLFGNSAAELPSAFDQPHEKYTSSRFLDFRDGVLDNNGFSGISNFHASESNSFLLKPNTSCMDSICSTSDYPFEQGSKSLCGSAVRISCLAGMAGMETEAELFDNSDTGLVHGMDLVPVTFTASSFSKYPGIVDRHHDPKDRNSILPVGADDTCLDSLSPYSEHPCKRNWENTSDFSTELWSSSHHAQSRDGSLGAMFGFMSDQSICSDFEDDHSMALVAANPKSSFFGTSDRAFFDSRSAMDSISETPMLSLDCVRW